MGRNFQGPFDPSFTKIEISNHHCTESPLFIVLLQTFKRYFQGTPTPLTKNKLLHHIFFSFLKNPHFLSNFFKSTPSFLVKIFPKNFHGSKFSGPLTPYDRNENITKSLYSVPLFFRARFLFGSKLLCIF